MRASTSRSWQTGSLIAGALMGLSMVGMVFAATEVEAASNLPIRLALASLMALVVGLVLQIVVTITPKQQPSKRATDMRTTKSTDPQISESVAT